MKKEPKKGICHVCGEYGKIAARNMCEMHYQRWRRHGTVDDPVYVNAGHTCSVDGCDDPAKLYGRCIKHDRRIRTHGDPNIVHTPSMSFEVMTYDDKQCLLHGCKEEKLIKELCYKHYHNFMYHKRSGLVKTIYNYVRLKEDNA
jgi:hypothetical protein